MFPSLAYRITFRVARNRRTSATILAPIAIAGGLALASHLAPGATTAPVAIDPEAQQQVDVDSALPLQYHDLAWQH